MTSRAKIGLFLAFCTSVGVHGVAYASLSPAPRELVRSNEASQINFELPPLPMPEPPAPSVTPEPTPPLPSTAARTPVVNHQPNRVPAAPSTPTTVAPALDLSGVTLTNDSGAGFAMPVGDGSAHHGPIGSGTSHAQGAPPPVSAPSVPKSPALVDVSDLSERPKPPSLTGLLRQNYPEEARQRGLRGSASLRARIDADGVIRNARVLSESAAGFGSACRRTVLGSRWSAPRDKNGSAVATEIVYTCHFEVDQ
jgi:periplasmic protein TonB